MVYAWNLKHPFINGYFNWRIPNYTNTANTRERVHIPPGGKGNHSKVRFGWGYVTVSQEITLFVIIFQGFFKSGGEDLTDFVGECFYFMFQLDDSKS